MTSLAFAGALSATRTSDQNLHAASRSRCPFLVDMQSVHFGPTEDSLHVSLHANTRPTSGSEASSLVQRLWSMPEHPPETRVSVLRYLRSLFQASELSSQQRVIAISMGPDGPRVFLDREVAETLARRQQPELSPNLPVVSLVERATAVIDELTDLARGWDGYDGIPVLPQVAEHARRFLQLIGEHTQILAGCRPAVQWWPTVGVVRWCL